MDGVSGKMLDSVTNQLSDQFQHNSTAFLEWFTTAKGTRLNRKLELADLRDFDAGRGAGKNFWSWRRDFLLISPFSKLPKKAFPKMKNSLPFRAPLSSTLPTQTFKSR
jgi:hypothetical protein